MFMLMPTDHITYTLALTLFETIMTVYKMSAALEELISVTLKESLQGRNKVSTLIENVGPYAYEQIVIGHDRTRTTTYFNCQSSSNSRQLVGVASE
jgi:hypothetical protein